MKRLICELFTYCTEKLLIGVIYIVYCMNSRFESACRL